MLAVALAAQWLVPEMPWPVAIALGAVVAPPDGIVVSWADMRGIVTRAAASAIPETLPNGSSFPYRDLILLCAFAVVLSTLVLQGLTMKLLIGRIGLTDDDPAGREMRLGRARAYQALVDAIKDDDADRETITEGIRRGG